MMSRFSRFAAVGLFLLVSSAPSVSHPAAGLWLAPDENYCAPAFSQSVSPPTLRAVIAAINARFPRPRLVLQTLRGDKATVVVKDADYLTQRMGSTGAAIYMISATFSLTSLKGLRLVRFRFEEGDHARPGTYSRNSILKGHGCGPD